MRTTRFFKIILNRTYLTEATQRGGKLSLNMIFKIFRRFLLIGFSGTVIIGLTLMLPQMLIKNPLSIQSTETNSTSNFSINPNTTFVDSSPPPVYSDASVYPIENRTDNYLLILRQDETIERNAL